MVGKNPERQSLIAREMDLLLTETERVENHLFDLSDNDPEVPKEKAWLEHIRVRRAELEEELLKLQGVLDE